jgi:branched-chain amino acid transport system substrate-binding protein
MSWLTRWRGPVRLLGGGVAALLLVTACSSAGDDSSSGSSSSLRNTATGTPLKVMVINDDSDVQPLPDAKAVAEGYAEKINAAGGIKNHPVEVSMCSGQLNPNTTLQCAQKAIDEGFVATVGDFMTNDLGATKALADAGVAQLGLYPVSQDSYSCSTCYPVVGGSIGSVAAQNTICPDVLGGAKLGIAIVDVPEAHKLPGLVSAILEQRGDGATVEKVVYIPNTTSDYSSFVAEMKGADVDCINVALPRLQSLSFIRAAAAQGNTVPLTSSNNSLAASDLAQLGAAADDLYVEALYNLSGPAYDEVTEIEKDAGDDIPVGNENGTTPYVGLKILQEIGNSIKGDITRESIAAAAKTFKWDGGGITQPVDFGAYDTELLGPDFPRLITGAYYAKASSSGFELACGGSVQDWSKPATDC